MTEFFAITYAVGGSYTHGGDIDTEYDEQPAGLTTVWDVESLEWREIACAEHAELGTCWVPYVDGRPETDGRCCSWNDLLGEFGPVWDGKPEDISASSAWAGGPPW